MRINILTQPLFTNYGGILQNYALQEVLRRMGHSPLTVNLPPNHIVPKVAWKDAVKSTINLIRKISGRHAWPFISPYTLACKERELSFPQRQFIKKHINKVDIIPPFTSDVCAAFPADAWIVGSDQVWRPWCSHFIENCFLDFLDDTVKKVSYAASFGTDEWEISPGMTARLASLVKRFNAISVRESSGVTMCREHLGVTARHVLDPTMLLKAEDYLGLISENEYPEAPYVATYILDNNKAKQTVIAKFARKHHLKVQPTGLMHRGGFDSIESWLVTIAHADYVITDSFHGTVFSILFGRPFKLLRNDVRGNARLESLLTMLRLIQSNDGLYHPSEVAGKLNELRYDSIDFLSNALA